MKLLATLENSFRFLIERNGLDRIVTMALRSTLRTIRNWRDLARQSCYQATNLAELCQVSPRTLRRFFHEELRTSLRVWLKRQRNHEAKSALRIGVLVKEAAMQAAYKHTGHFSRQFKRSHGILPSQWLEQRQNSTEAASNSDTREEKIDLATNGRCLLLADETSAVTSALDSDRLVLLNDFPS